MAKKNGSVAPKERINITYVPATNGEQEEVELPLRLLVTGDLLGREEETALEDRIPVSVNKDNFNDVMAGMNLGLKMDVPNRLSEGADDTLHADLKFRSIDDFSPDAVARQIPELNKLLELREALVALKGPLGNVPAFRKQLQTMLGDERARSKLAKELEAVLGESVN
ncbi:TPA: type VI secretion system contractile sheath small subunit [Pseudomonas aeruginosa]|uniref:type VI secretion system contractile sheath small subunit n=1 Tax=Pseudomonas aeruginosa TaxID=287 RepID=UPI000F536F23|nr:type VI secretion system contractile sheath small subunit [Pseudomonas aeruginosa]MBU8393864.1 type VI secretion system contractile sheath small subunit [Pseudomonas aeruginosa]RPM87999.1 type VI secretion system contractile sheath small subunit [Pseudomonas aeruginosa]RPS08913.1 type VI secretion system contractile sheath small subunit [Pseudomonas aeruginosa]HCE7029509.1 type VI secretion system contractile sheath small subunit [Pseudomonas aeruginosa]HCL3572609.1 type VI secretion system